MTTLVLGATGATGRWLVRQLVERGEHVRVVVRSREALPEDLREHSAVSVTVASVLDLDDGELAQLIQGCSAVASCLGHNLSFKGLFGPPYRLVTEATRRVCEAIQAIQANRDEHPTRFVLMNTAGNSNRDIAESVSLGQKLVLALLRVLVPPHADNEKASDYLRLEIGQNDRAVQWAVVRPDGLTNAEEVTEYEVHRSPTRSAIFNAGKTSRINVAHFMAALMTEEEPWSTWRGQMPVIYNRSDS